MKAVLITLVASIIISCNSGHQVYKRDPQTTVEGALKELWRGRIMLAEQQQSTDVQVFWMKHKEEILNNMVVSDKYVSSKGNLCLVLYRTSVGDKNSKKTQWFRKLDNEWIASNAYFSSINDDPLHDGNGEEVKKWIDKATTWDQEDLPDVWW